MVRPSGTAAILAISIALAGCPSPGERPTVGDALVVDPSTVQLGDPVGMFHVVGMSARFERPGLWYGRARFEGEVELAGRYFAFEPADADASDPCFEVDGDHAGHLPRFPGDERTAWFCFGFPDAAIGQLGAPTPEGRLTSVVIESYDYVHEPTDDVNVAVLADPRARGHVLPSPPGDPGPEPRGAE